MASKPFRHT
ncbi:hypothetical protein E2C01_065623 [Portunus trituberculatus]|uniref:Uncharacterized protein n=1 Tax=Portunus trituberculatus TaxID=210409 RepID=A0A5B7HN19_PORTR|nr:hypothetical protein [Portunus trituberculatus]